VIAYYNGANIPGQYSGIMFRASIPGKHSGLESRRF